MHWAPLALSCPAALQLSLPWVPPLHPVPLPPCSSNSSSSRRRHHHSHSHTILPPTPRCFHSPPLPCPRVGPPPPQPIYLVASLVPPLPWGHHLTLLTLSHPCSPNLSPPARCSSPPLCRHSTPARRWDTSFSLKSYHSSWIAYIQYFKLYLITISCQYFNRRRGKSFFLINQNYLFKN